MKSRAIGRSPYLVKSVVHCCQVLVAFRSPLKTLTLSEIVARSGLPKTMVFRLLYTLEKCGMVEKREQKLYRATVRPVKGKHYKLAYAVPEVDQTMPAASNGEESAAYGRFRVDSACQGRLC